MTEGQKQNYDIHVASSLSPYSSYEHPICSG